LFPREINDKITLKNEKMLIVNKWEKKRQQQDLNLRGKTQQISSLPP
jgi:hypothetical protein